MLRFIVRPPNEAGGSLTLPLSRVSLALVLAAALGLTFGVSRASADSITYSLGFTNNSALASLGGPYGTVEVNRTSATTAKITLTSQAHGGNIFLFGDGATLALNTNATVSVGAITTTNAGTGFDSWYQVDLGSGQVDGLGSFSTVIKGFDGFTHSVDSLSFTLTNTSGTWADAAHVLDANNKGFHVAGHVYPTTSPANASNGVLNNINTAFAGDNGFVNPVPEPASIVLVGLGAVGAFGYGLRRRLLSPRITPA